MQNKRLLIVEDDYDVAEMLLMYFTAQQYEVFHADNGPEGIELARKKFPNLILLDVMLPDINGYEVCAELRQTSLTRHIPVIFLTQKDGRADKVEGLELGADDYIAKPFDVDELRLRVQRSIERATRESLHEPRTGLPTGSMVEETFDQLDAQNTTFTEYRLEISGYRAFADKYGFMAADQVMAFAAKSIYEAVSEYGTPDDFIGLVGDQFVIFSHTQQPQALYDAMTEHFREGVRAFYTFTDVEQGGILLNEGQDDERLVPLMELHPVPTAANA
jgi:DNA-binding response OmpR family regulator